jgi:hypothetical protein
MICFCFLKIVLLFPKTLHTLKLCFILLELDELYLNICRVSPGNGAVNR